MLWIGFAILFYGSEHFGFCKLGASIALPQCIGSYSLGHRCFLRDEKFWGETTIFAWFYALDCFGYFCLINGNLMVFLNYGDSIDQPQCLNF